MKLKELFENYKSAFKAIAKDVYTVAEEVAYDTAAESKIAVTGDAIQEEANELLKSIQNQVNLSKLKELKTGPIHIVDYIGENIGKVALAITEEKHFRATPALFREEFNKNVQHVIEEVKKLIPELIRKKHTMGRWEQDKLKKMEWVKN